MVTVDGQLYVRAYRGPSSRWFRAAQDAGTGTITARTVARDVRLIPDPGPAGTIDDAYQAKYGNSTLVASPQARAADKNRMREAASLSCGTARLPGSTVGISAVQGNRTSNPVTARPGPARPMSMRWISLVPSKIVKIREGMGRVIGIPARPPIGPCGWGIAAFPVPRTKRSDASLGARGSVAATGRVPIWTGSGTLIP